MDKLGLRPGSVETKWKPVETTHLQATNTRRVSCDFKTIESLYLIEFVHGCAQPTCSSNGSGVIGTWNKSFVDALPMAKSSEASSYPCFPFSSAGLAPIYVVLRLPPIRLDLSGLNLDIRLVSIRPRRDLLDMSMSKLMTLYTPVRSKGRFFLAHPSIVRVIDLSLITDRPIAATLPGWYRETKTGTFITSTLAAICLWALIPLSELSGYVHIRGSFPPA